jgi:hypothetical protein
MTTRARARADRGQTNTGPHKTLRKRLLADLARRPGQPCPRCGLPMYVTQLLDLDHTDDRAGYLGLSHRSCNRRAGQRKTTAILNARGWAPSMRQWRAAAYRPRARAAPPQRSSRAW